MFCPFELVEKFLRERGYAHELRRRYRKTRKGKLIFASWPVRLGLGLGLGSRLNLGFGIGIDLWFGLCLATVFSTFWLPGSDNLAKEPPMSQISAFPSIKALSILLLVPLNSTSLPWWTTLSIIAEASLSSPRIVPHLLNSMLVVNTTLRFS